MCTKVNNFLVRALLRLLLSLRHDAWVSSTLESLLLYYSFSGSPTLSDVISANSLQEHQKKVHALASGFRASVYSKFGDLLEPCKIDIMLPKGSSIPVHIRSYGFCRVAFSDFSAELYDLLPGDIFTISFNEPSKE